MTLLLESYFASLGFADKSLWDWVGLLGVPTMVAIIAGLFAVAAQGAGRRARVERELAIDRAREEILQGYFDRITDLIVEKGLQESGGDSPVRAVVHARTHAALRTLDGPRKGILVRFLQEANLIVKGQTVISLALADLTNADLSGADLRGANLSLTNLRGADLYDADLRDADRHSAVVTEQQLARASNLVGATFIDGTEVTDEAWQRLKEWVL